MKVLTGFLLNTLIIFTDPTNRNERRQKAKTGSYRR